MASRAAASSGMMVGSASSLGRVTRRQGAGGRRCVARRAVIAGGARAAVEVVAGSMGDPPVNVVVQTARGEVIDCMSALMRNRIIFIGDRIDENVATRICAELLALQYEDPRADIKIFLNCTSGTQYCVTTILDMMDYVSPDISVIAMGCVAGPPALLLAGATKGKRFAYPSARIILSQPLGGLAGTSYEVRIQAKELSRNARVQVALFAQFTGRSFDDMGQNLTRDTYMSPTEAITEGLIDGVIGLNEVKLARAA
mmetsp:Transcript_4623/g.7275  ORF Transcript_4623/g.7275 Transcript_4623/m.7275 type:complete len:256 (-) Transcript_4623:210-977(-)